MLIAFFDARGIVHMEFLSQGQTVNQHVYKEILRRLLLSVCEKRCELWQDNAPAPNALSIRQFLAERNVTVLDHLSYSPDLASCGFFMFPQAQGGHQGSPFSGYGSHQEGPWRRNWNVSRKNPSRSAYRHGRTEWESMLDSKEITLKKKICSLYRFLAINCLWPQSWNFSDTPHIFSDTLNLNYQDILYLKLIKKNLQVERYFSCQLKEAFKVLFRSQIIKYSLCVIKSVDS